MSSLPFDLLSHITVGITCRNLIFKVIDFIFRRMCFVCDGQDGTRNSEHENVIETQEDS